MILPLNDYPFVTNMVAEVRFERTSLAYETKLEPAPVYSAVKLLRPHRRAALDPGSGIEPESAAYRAATLPLSYPGMDLGAILEIAASALRVRCSAA